MIIIKVVQWEKYILSNIGGILMLHYPLMVFVDTNIFISCKYNLNGNGYFSILKKFIKDGKIKLHIDNIVRQEVEIINYNNRKGNPFILLR